MTPDEFREALDEYDREGRFGTEHHVRLLPELFRRAREHLAAEATIGTERWPVIIDEMLAAMGRAAPLDSDNRSEDKSGPDIDRVQAYRNQILAALTAAKIKTAEAVAAERERIITLALTLHQNPEWDHCHQAVERYGAALADAIRARGSSS